MRLLVALLCSLALCNAVPFPKGAHQCPDVCHPEETCCKSNSTLTHGCCPIPQATCCSDGLHCCPSGFKCDISQNACLQGDLTLKWSPKMEVKFRVTITCPGGTHDCPENTTCCLTAKGDYGCCPLAKAACCKDHTHCCPSGFKCDESAGKCRQGNRTLPFLEKFAARPRTGGNQDQVCPGGKSTCPTTSTCCMLKNGKYGCCPMEKAVCCEDQVHCCPNGFTCAATKCKMGEYSIPLFSKTEAKIRETNPAKDAKVVTCPDGLSACKDNTTCCKDDTGEYGCCPIPQAECCDDQIHCCPAGFTCQTEKGKCSKGGMVVPFLTKTRASVMSEEIESVHCDDGSACPNHHTCCKTQTGKYGCCPLPKAVCCKDEVHCCPDGYTCDTAKSRCIKGDMTLPWLEKRPSKSSRKVTKEDPGTRPPPGAVVCPDHVSMCPDNNTCCLLQDGSYGCCPEPHAVCCSDRKHCCPQGYTCDTSQGKCLQGYRTIPWIENKVAPPSKVTHPNKIATPNKVEPPVNPIDCDEEGKVKCPDKNTCCKKTTGEWGCCPLEKALCCEDKVHCCPHGTVCNKTSGECHYPDGTSQAWVQKTPPLLDVRDDAKDVPCPDGKSACEEEYTCCKNSTGYGCCPFFKAVCCNDTVHCCPQHYTCNSGAPGTCIHNFLPTVPMAKKTAPKMVQLNKEIETDNEILNNVRCDTFHECPANNTCCKLSSGQWGCCPLPSAVCCDDHVHCCPEGTTCSVSTGKCHKGDISIPWFEKSPAKTVENDPNIMCDATHECPSKHTCCKLASGQWGCCPLPSAVCCNDHVHCCPEGTTCSVSTGKCHKGDNSITWFEKVSAITKEVSNVKCDATHECPSKHTCCKLASGQWGCCPLPSAVCCNDHVHCCPEDTTCEVSSGKCKRKDISLPWFEKIPAITTEEVSNVKCDATHECPTKHTCCKLASGQWGCCPLPSAVCCDDHVHCCPEDTTCEVSSGKCKRKDISFPWFEKKVAINVEESPNIKCDNTHECKATDTCCKLKSGQWGCCPLPKAVCCNDQVHCCPEGTTCSVSTGKCHKGDVSITWFEKVPSIPMEEEVFNVKCDATHECPTKHTCCKLASGQWGCCPLPSAVCCNDHVHCCPEDTTCSVSTGKCEKGDTSLPWFEKTSAMTVEDTPNVMCDATHECKAKETCCKLASGQWGCCPLPKAVCCDDHVHCCPEGTTCSVSTGKCHKGDISIPWFEKVSAITKENEVSNVKCDATHECPSKHTCCKLASGQWGCCPLPSAVCCDDHVHCCPEGTTCEVSSGKCKRKDISFPWFEKVPAITTVQEVSNVKCDATHECPSKHTCCKLASGQWGCCPLPSAVCCNDHVHCCPEDTTCEVSSGKCKRKDISFPWFEKVPAITTVQEVSNVKCDATHECPSKHTCCKLASGQWGCCPLPSAVCCNDHVHCCPEGTTCSVSTGKCEKGEISLPWFKKTSAITVEDAPNVMCDATHECKARETCCKLASGQWGCCPLPKAVCCDDKVHCCPEGTTCSVSTGKCHKGDVSIPWLEKVPSIAMEEEVSNVKCDATHECPAKHTCCKLTSGQWGCCPLPSAVCCNDHVHCCPKDTTCEVSSGKCKRKDISFPWFEKKAAINVEESPNIKCDSTHECKATDTCCKLKSGQWGCCPLPKAVCCNDQVHCCPEGTTCSVSTGKCHKGDVSITWFEKVLSIAMEEELSNVKCDSTHECPSKHTCCKLASGQWGCCPLPSAVCCNDHVHCCPEDTTCEVSSGKCKRKDISLPWFEKIPAITTEEVSNVKCDATHECPTKHTCCKLASGQWGCCPLPSAVCCNDHVHCCPEDTTCEVSSGKCKRKDISFPWFEKVPAITTEKEVGNVKCDATHECPTKHTCCKLASGQWGCCPLPSAVCCNDHVHCCPEDTTCEVSSGKCKRKDISFPWFEKVPAITTVQEVSNVKCDATHECPSKHTCSKLASGQWGCCPLPSAVCCNDHVHCCPEDTTCEVSSGKCKRKDASIPWFEKVPAITTVQEVSNVKCDATQECPSKHTCCKLASGQWGCCPLPSAVCCNDHVHCCPEDTTCEVSSGKCKRKDVSIPWFEKVPAITTVKEVFNVKCDATHECPSKHTCCKLASGQWGCCPLPSAVCCNDHVHCCPEDTTCEVSSRKCKRKDSSIPWFEKVPAITTAHVSNVKCDATHECPSKHTCCKLASGQWGCCPLPSAVCCNDHVHCCPEGTTCSVSTGKCEKGEISLSWFEKTSAITVEDAPNVMCDATHECKARETCCKLASGQWGCCPLPKAVCCDDKVHCCPEGTTCSVSTGKCNKGDASIAWFEKSPAKTVQNDQNIMCDATHECPAKHTCCKLASGQWGCCPLPSAVCCDDHVHCCPEDTTCEVSSGKCKRKDSSIPWFEKVPAITTEEVSNVKCDATHECPSKHTCCKLASGQWGCCPLPSAVCCNDHVHCCPEGTTCSVSTGKCEKGEISLPWFEKTSVIIVEDAPNVMCDATHECKSRETCCKLASGQWGCCPLPKAVCCDDKVHCCPEGTTCSVSTGKCHKGDVSIPWFEKVPSIAMEEEVSNVKCDATHECPAKHTCCKLASGQWGCCPLPSAVCCNDHIHCCPEDTTCEVSSGKCKRKDISFPWFEKKAAINVEESPNIKCDSTHECKATDTCCKLKSGQWGCCPLPKAVCCDDQVHCCPEGTTCSVSTGKCHKGDTTIAWFEKLPAKTVQNDQNIMCDATHECPSKHTCCKLASGQWGCCPLPSAVCCDDHVHCCPEDTTCEVSSGKCKRKDASIPWFEKVPAITTVQQVSNVKCDATHECPTKHTCCKLASGQWGCCPLPSAVCCNDHVHCCPEGTTCSVSTGKCEKGELSLPWFEKTSAKAVEEAPNVMCDATHECKAKETCCKLASGQWGCCPLPKAVCCDDKVHCCPEGTTCSVSTGKCHKGDVSITWFEKVSAITKEVSNVKCDATHECPSKHTCCKLASGQWGCCPLPSAVCCNDHVHCCPEGTTCSVSTGKCVKGEISLAWFKKTSAITVEDAPNVMCDSTHECKTKETCCKLASGQWGCCPLPKAVCCDDKVHCCPEGTTCSVSTGKCHKGDVSITWFEKSPAKTVQNDPNIMCDATHECPAKHTCCKLASGQWGCCPLPSAVCCDDHVHCCPEDTTCEVSSGKCKRKDSSIPWFEKVPAITTVQEESNVKCDSTHECPSKHTCCKLASGQWGCCPLPSAVCCNDHVHCCPEDTTCEVSSGKCKRKDISFPWFEKKAAINVEESPNIKCDNTHECKATDTCCKLKSGQWGCCPLPKAVCCDDKVHCCPEGTTCSVSTGKCNKGDVTIAWFEKSPAKTVQNDPNIMCDATHECPARHTCCKLASGQWGCCPLPSAVCCDDHVHCCPEDTTCEVSSGKCKRKDSSIPWFEKVPAITTVQEVSDVKCDATHECPSKHTCCKLASGQWGCCPLPSAVCCNDHVHCCPEGTTCKVSTGKCEKGEISFPWLEKKAAIVLEESPNIKCDSTHECKATDTCCKLKSGQWGCCPLPKAVCCDDKVHCCPEGTTCSVSTGKCNKGDVSIFWFEKVPAIITEEVSNVKCDTTHECPSKHTCCKLASGQWGCCPLPSAVCCNDHVHCCPEDTTCEVSSGKCKRKDISFLWFEKVPAIVTVEEVSNVKCDATHECPTKHTCCKLASGQWGCCPLPSAVCCDDHVHCCPEDTTCEVSSGKCKRKESSIPWFEKVPAITTVQEVSNVKCDATHECPSKHTCCKLASGQWGCCPLPSAVCCNDHVHCCPEDTTCEVSSGKCKRKDADIPWFKKVPAISTEEVSNVKCDATHECPSKHTCCKLASGQWGCCPLPSAVCCNDHVHCCPEDTTCEVSSGKCKRKDIIIPWFEKVPAITTVQEVSNVKCDATHECPSKHTCCKLASGQWGCCPLPSAVCCNDHVHCCPEDTTCSVSTGKCEKGELSLPWFEKTSAITVEEAPNVMCDATHECKAKETCCKLKSGQWGCCPLPKAVCCDDKVHCCPEGTTCSVSTGKCHKGDVSITWFEKVPSIAMEEEVFNVKCDATHECPTKHTCCKLASGQWGCCPLPSAVCCNDHVHCCPEGTTCSVSTGKCEKGEISMPWFEKTSAITVEDAPNVMCDATHECKAKETCCKLKSGQWGCCPLPKAVCCDDKVHCCPEGTTCSVSTGKCHKGDVSIAWFEKSPAKNVQNDQNIMCDATHECPAKHTCCKLSSGQWGCCPLPSAVCCNDHVHCCPEGTTCSVSTGKCEKGEISLPWFEKTSAITVEEAPNVMCDATHECKTKETCCKLASGQWGCCPLPKAVCCNDHVHCCPEGTTCSVSTGKCHKGDVSITWFEKVPSITMEEEVSNVKCDATHECPTKHTCCKLASGQWGCCPLPSAVCCDDHVHCCPEGTTCSVSTGKCKHGDISLPWFEKKAALTVDVEKTPCPGGKQECATNYTCCQRGATPYTWGCCDFPNAVCCPDRKTCCPKGYHCDPSRATCFKSERDEIVVAKQLAIPDTEQSEVGNVICPGGEYQCPEKTTCCVSPSGTFGCCPVPEAVCCADGVHCCPKDHTCDPSSQTCKSASGQLPWLDKLLAKQVKVKDIKCGSSSSTCGDTETCCKMATGQWGCCPMPKAVCCEDHLHCCPRGYKCDMPTSTCIRGNNVLPMAKKRLADVFTKS
ncbi:uncharacterized protein LOC144859249 isoform X1 [Branchiostoma floridae x Branchiostoma japonicum]